MEFMHYGYGLLFNMEVMVLFNILEVMALFNMEVMHCGYGFRVPY
jgi:hypothetical protein